MRIDVLTLFPEALEPYFAASIIGRAQAAGIVTIRCTDIRDFAPGRHQKVDDRPFGGGPGMVMMCSPVFDAVEHVEREDPTPATRILLTPQGEPFTQEIARQLASESRLLLICGHYEGFDERIRLGLQPREISIGDYVLSGGEPAAMVVVDAVVRLLPGALGDEESTENESFSEGLLEYPQYTRPREYRGMSVPEIVLSGDHARIERWRKIQALRRTRERRPDLFEKIIKAQPELSRLVDEGAD
ncbi:MAG TPA: tRNA (guanosine(37)-N1)-methyltransferase TrmD [Phycisphaerae bacterium]|nr:tRNA (guanosine(37)-N1)-methyltransferase TrmD [Phycisphaerae bacterium]HOJ75897.1 tRNA (guanosine(37)-N1)-methyltransferase TrmD [Phycisphaerae bacterium]HOM52327.1 tRNA (guanosine(37)-N1)-methyltransferase TrmD [Phycisphaerae bacterium]HPP24889.1 tRNA (guanosine(37)-N1)-methyltransferase TrmD [Phycisphaerae bacterium]HPU26939.1 tRNA (guanosine(37)-N1)-methyltransferase TrmD [Phycisphaerae bacterium]